MPAFLGDVFHWIWQERTKIIALMLVLVLLAPQPAKGQFIDWAVIVAAINAIGTAISNVIGSGLQAINSALGAVNTILNTINSFFQNQIYPQAAINRARGVVGAVQGIYNAIRGLVNLNVASATLANPRQLETVLLSRNPANACPRSVHDGVSGDPRADGRSSGDTGFGRHDRRDGAGGIQEGDRHRRRRGPIDGRFRSTGG